MGSPDYRDFRDALIDRHRNPVTSGLSIVGDMVLIAALPVALARHSLRAWVNTTIVGYAIAVVAHLFQRGSLRPEVGAFARHPVWAVRSWETAVAARAVSGPCGPKLSGSSEFWAGGPRRADPQAWLSARS
jgi:hypothetical protein